MMNKLKETRQVPQAQQEVWNLKQNLYEEIKNMNTTDGLNYLLEKGRKAALRNNLHFQVNQRA
ncbi:MAG: hypothetical protein DRR16_18825 [Candidatus Parabeggiatoa sp. nov. 3]|nr:MAG: hypothetical protein DRQ99_09165 [Gammaproteobacteria bacterium]RKZ82818.1 MAG: hypothetical protein DRR16_18825 [Gammaproteobacteria bacterium]